MIPETMSAVLLTGHGGLDKLKYSDDVPVRLPKSGEVLIQIGAAGVNNTDINTRIGWYSKAIVSDTNIGGAEGFQKVDEEDATWTGEAMSLPRIQGADICGEIIATGNGVDKSRVGERVLVQTMQPQENLLPFTCATVGSEFDGGFAQYAVSASKHTYKVNSNWSDVDLASIPCAYSTAENMLHRASVGAERVLITGASGGVGSAAIQLAKRRGATVIALASSSKFNEVLSIGADKVIDRNSDLLAELGEDSIDVIVDLVAGAQWPIFLKVLCRGGRYAVAGAIAGPIVELDIRTLYLKDLTFFGCTYQDPQIFKNVISYIESGEIKPLVAKTYALKDIKIAQHDFLAKKYTGKLVLIPPSVKP